MQRLLTSTLSSYGWRRQRLGKRHSPPCCSLEVCDNVYECWPVLRRLHPAPATQHSVVGSSQFLQGAQLRTVEQHSPASAYKRGAGGQQMQRRPSSSSKNGRRTFVSARCRHPAQQTAESLSQAVRLGRGWAAGLLRSPLMIPAGRAQRFLARSCRNRLWPAQHVTPGTATHGPRPTLKWQDLLLRLGVGMQPNSSTPHIQSTCTCILCWRPPAMGC